MGGLEGVLRELVGEVARLEGNPFGKGKIKDSPLT